MYLSIVQLAQGRGQITISRKYWISYTGMKLDNGEPTGYRVTHRSTSGAVISKTDIDYIDGENARDTKSRAIAAVRMLGYWPEMRREIAEDRGVTELVRTGGYGAGKTHAARVEQLRESGLILPPGAEQ